jgi:hypothetical protein
LVEVDVIVTVTFEDNDEIVVQDGVRKLQDLPQPCEDALAATIEGELGTSGIDIDGDVGIESITVDDSENLVIVYQVTVSVPCTQAESDVCRAQTEAAVNSAFQTSISNGDFSTELNNNLTDLTGCDVLEDVGTVATVQSDVCFTSEVDCPTNSTQIAISDAQEDGERLLKQFDMDCKYMSGSVHSTLHFSYSHTLYSSLTIHRQATNAY